MGIRNVIPEIKQRHIDLAQEDRCKLPGLLGVCCFQIAGKKAVGDFAGNRLIAVDQRTRKLDGQVGIQGGGQILLMTDDHKILCFRRSEQKVSAGQLPGFLVGGRCLFTQYNGKEGINGKRLLHALGNSAAEAL